MFGVVDSGRGSIDANVPYPEIVANRWNSVLQLRSRGGGCAAGQTNAQGKAI